MRIQERIAYLRGMLAGRDGDGLAASKATWDALLDVLDEIAGQLAELQRAQREMDGYLEALDEDLADVEQAVLDHADDDEILSGGLVEIRCPACGEEAVFDASALDGEAEEFVCPNCEEIFSLDELGDASGGLPASGEPVNEAGASFENEPKASEAPDLPTQRNSLS